MYGLFLLFETFFISQALPLGYGRADDALDHPNNNLRGDLIIKKRENFGVFLRDTITSRFDPPVLKFFFIFIDLHCK